MADPASYRPKEIPELPGVYRFYNGKDKVIYVGKAKNLKNRLTTYFGSNLARKTHRMVNEAVRVTGQLLPPSLKRLPWNSLGSSSISRLITSNLKTTSLTRT